MASIKKANICLFLERQAYLRVLFRKRNRYLWPKSRVYSALLASILYLMINVMLKSGHWFCTTLLREKIVSKKSEVEINLRNADFNVMKMKWENALDLPGILHGQLTGIRESTSVLFVCIMSHGNCGTLRGDNNSLMPISDILFTLTDKLPPTLPLVKVITAVTHYNWNCKKI